VCGRFTLTSSPEELARRFGLDDTAELAPRYNIAPGQDVLAVRVDTDGRRRADALRWGLVPPWAPDPSVGNRMINARVETAATRPAFRDALRERRCLVPADGFYEWADRGGFKQPYYIRASDGALFAFAGLWERWTNPDGVLLESCTLLTTDAAQGLRDLHHRMPVMLAPDAYAGWLDPAFREPLSLLDRASDATIDAFQFHPVSMRVNGAALDDPACIAVAPEPPRQESLF
jgi:putative SOS response-associated peptidase YedK